MRKRTRSGSDGPASLRKGYPLHAPGADSRARSRRPEPGAAPRTRWPGLPARARTHETSTTPCVHGRQATPKLNPENHTPTITGKRKSTMTAPTLAASGHSISETAIGWDRTTTVVTVKFSEAIKGFDTTDVSLPQGAGRVTTVSSVAPRADGSSDTWLVTIESVLTWNSPSKLQNPVTVDLAGVTNAAGEAGTGTMDVPGILYDVDATRPTVDIRVSDSSLLPGGVTDVMVEFKEPVTGFDEDDMRSLTVQNGTLGSFRVSDNGLKWYAKLTADRGVEVSNRSITMDTVLAGIMDLAGNRPLFKTVSSNAYAIDPTPPTLISFAISDHDLRAGRTATVTITFNEMVLGLNNRDHLEVSGGTLSELKSSTDGKVWTATLTPPENSIVPHNSVRMKSFLNARDAAGNLLTGTLPAAENFAVDTVRPHLAANGITISDNALCVGETATVSVTFDIPVQNVSAAVSAPNGTLSGWSPNASGTVWSATLTPTANVEASGNHITVDMIHVLTPSGNAGLGQSNSGSDYTVDTRPPQISNNATENTVNGTQLVLSYIEAIGLDAAHVAATGTFALRVNGTVVANAVTAVSVNATAKTVTLTLANNAVGHGDTVLLSYTDPTSGNDANAIQDAAGNDAVSFAEWQIQNNTPDTTPPVLLSIAIADRQLKIGDTAQVSIRFSEVVTGFGKANLNVPSGTLSDLTASEGGVLWSGTLTPAANTVAASNAISVRSLAGVEDAAHNTATGSSVTSENYQVNTVAPQLLSIALDDSALKIGDTPRVTVTFSEAVSGFGKANLSLSAGTLSELTAAEGGKVWTGTLTPAANTAAATNAIRVNTLSGVKSAADNAATGSDVTSTNYSVDTVAPQLTHITLDDSTLKAGETATVTITFSEAVTGFNKDHLIVSSGTLGALTRSADGLTWTGTLTPTANITVMSNTIRVNNLSGVADAVGNPATGSGVASDNYSVDTVAPLLTRIALDDSALKIGETATVTVTFSETVDGMTAAHLSTPHGTLGALTRSADGLSWTGTLTPEANTTAASNAISVNNLSGVKNAANNAAVGIHVTSDNYSVDTVAPELTGITLADSALKIGETTTLTVTFSEVVSGLTAAHLTTPSGTLGALTRSADGLSWTGTLTPAADTTAASNAIRVNNLSGVTDAVGNLATGSGVTSANYSVDTVAPQLTHITLGDNALKAGETTSVTISFNEAVTGFGKDHLSVSSGTLGALTRSADGLTWTGTLTPAANTTAAANTISVNNLSGVTDAAGNLATGSDVTSTNYRVDTVVPQLQRITLDDSALKIGATTTVTVTFSEVVDGLVAAHLTTPSGTLGPLTRSAYGLSWTGTLTPAANTTAASNAISVNNLSGVADAAGNPATGSDVSSTNYRVDTVAPQLTHIALDDSTLKIGETATVTVTFSEAVDGFGAAHLSTPNGTLGALTRSADGLTWTGTLTPAANTTAASNAISVNNLSGVTDAAGNLATGSPSSSNYAVSTVVPTLSSIAIDDRALRTGETATVTITFSIAVSGFGKANLNVPAGTLSDLTASAGGKVWTGTLTPAVNVTAATNAISVNTLSGVADAAGNPAMGSDVTSENYAVDTAVPTLNSIAIDDRALKAGATASVTITFSEAVIGFGKANLSVPHGTLSDLSASEGGKVWTGTLTPTANTTAATNAIHVNTLGGVTDAAGNPAMGSDVTSANYAVDTVRPALLASNAIMLSERMLAFGETASVSFHFNTAVQDISAAASASNGTLSNWSANADGTVWSATLTPTANVEASTNQVTLDPSRVLSVSGNAGEGPPGYSENYTVDTVAPTFNRATASGNQLVLSYTEGTTLDAMHPPAPGNFEVRLDDAVNAVTAVAVNAVAKTVTLTLEHAALPGQKMKLWYTNPTAGDDTNAIQDAAGNDAASLADESVDNPLLPSRNNASDRDNDSVPGNVEDRVPGLSRPDGSLPVAGDGNGDGIKDSEQSTVGSTNTAAPPPEERDNPGNAPDTAPSTTTTTLVANNRGDQDGKSDTEHGTRVTHLEQKDAPTDLPPALEMPIGLTNFRAELSIGTHVGHFSLYVDAAQEINGYWMKNPSGTWVNLASEPCGGQMVLEGERLRLDFQIEDGGVFDANGLVDGTITAPCGAAARMPLSIAGQASDAESLGFWL
ncbi:glycosyl hydrolase [Verminephrobacter aporrectodeae subsp. tuberculatae]|nr:glycosyl hydrolase [Verminephrobacter aporrectodeae subsp. tuberculatae]MCW8203273.1 glycosyl hydrolase [Verminephrobacter aporrectodeae subsp. tuberculatae]